MVASMTQTVGADPARTFELLHCGDRLLPELAELGHILHDFSGRY